MSNPDVALIPDDSAAQQLYSLAANDPEQQLYAWAQVPAADLAEVNEIMQAMGRLREVERALAEASRKFMKLSSTDMRAVHFILTQSNLDRPVTASMLAKHLNVSTASITKLLDRLTAAGHLRRESHPTDRRATLIKVTEETAQAARMSMGRHQITRMKVALEFSSAERQIVARYLSRTAEAIGQSINSGTNDTSGFESGR